MCVACRMNIFSNLRIRRFFGAKCFPDGNTRNFRRLRMCLSVSGLAVLSFTSGCLCLPGKAFRHCNKVSFISPDGTFRIVKQAFPHSGMLNTDMLLCENGTVCPFFMSVCHLYTGLLFSVSQISVVKIFYLGNEYICGFVYEKRKP